MVEMAAQETTGGDARPAWADAPLRLDPYLLPQTVDAGGRTFTLAQDGARVRTALTNGAPLSMAVPKRAYRGVAARAFENEDGSLTVTLTLAHADPALCVPLAVVDTAEDAAADWHSWARRMNLPMMVEEADGRLVTVKDAGILTAARPAERRKRITTLKRRPNVLRRRKTGRVGPIEVLPAREIIARN